MARIWTLGFWRPRPEDAGEPPSSEAYTPGGVRVMRSVTAVMVVGGLVIAVIAGPLSSWSRRAAADLVDPAPYRQAVLDGRTP
ncbi:hypothetical protein [Actinomadura madurae]